MKKMLDCGYALYVDNFYTSVPVTEALLNRKTLICETLRENRKQLPKNSFTKLKKGQHIVKQKRRIVVEKWQDKKKVLKLSTLHFKKPVESNRQTKGRKKKKCLF